MDRVEEVKKVRHNWHWGKPEYRQRQCSKCGKVSTIWSHSSFGGCKPPEPKHVCPNPDCRNGYIKIPKAEWPKWTTMPCPTCQGTGKKQEEER